MGILAILVSEDWRLGAGFLLFLAGAFTILFRLRNFATRLLAGPSVPPVPISLVFLEERLGGVEDIRANGAVMYTIQTLFCAKCVLFGSAVWPHDHATPSLESIIVIWFEAGTALALALGAIFLQRDLLTIGTVYLLYAYLAHGQHTTAGHDR